MFGVQYWAGLYLVHYFLMVPNGALYINFLENNLRFNGKRSTLIIPANIWIQHDGAPAHNAASVRNCFNMRTQINAYVVEVTHFGQVHLLILPLQTISSVVTYNRNCMLHPLVVSVGGKNIKERSTASMCSMWAKWQYFSTFVALNLCKVTHCFMFIF